MFTIAVKATMDSRVASRWAMVTNPSASDADRTADEVDDLAAEGAEETPQHHQRGDAEGGVGQQLGRGEALLGGGRQGGEQSAEQGVQHGHGRPFSSSLIECWDCMEATTDRACNGVGSAGEAGPTEDERG